MKKLNTERIVKYIGGIVLGATASLYSGCDGRASPTGSPPSLWNSTSQDIPESNDGTEDHCYGGNILCLDTHGDNNSDYDFLSPLDVLENPQNGDFSQPPQNSPETIPENQAPTLNITRITISGLEEALADTLIINTGESLMMKVVASDSNGYISVTYPCANTDINFGHYEFSEVFQGGTATTLDNPCGLLSDSYQGTIRFTSNQPGSARFNFYSYDEKGSIGNKGPYTVTIQQSQQTPPTLPPSQPIEPPNGDNRENNCASLGLPPSECTGN
ncbi:MAG: hypothetical protein Q7S74_02050 [Nanoarchaeota archaeon]|nr:hypothetical protein [Nanoarchaeota archaeon]